jgi:hypothetical protein
MCTFCWKRRVSTGQAAAATAESQGIDPGDFRGPGAGSGQQITGSGFGSINVTNGPPPNQNTNQAVTMDALRQRFKN